ncbi:hypothetical protein [Bradyrhizobium sp. CCGUVB23]|uniref:hypothetical protein n=1 Tax=Bradyrhizobium sp. CCGUVB23 TaxID=2949630 RepID=UPI0020B1F6A4|nr:hypothetical protein [Bradyrhizobium sp. CCGUVB23]MCP3466697.1 hypothetical protein [Bradyrhizobium sp. CCGUVB23]
MAQYSVLERVRKATKAAMTLLIILAVFHAFGPSSAVLDTPISQLTLSMLMVPLIWMIILLECIKGAGVLLFEAIVGRDRVHLWGTGPEDERHQRDATASDEQRPVSSPGLRQAALPGWLSRGHSQSQ